jgi:hypothetical protein
MSSSRNATCAHSPACGRSSPPRPATPSRASWSSLPRCYTTVATDFLRCNPTEATVKGSEAPRLHALLPMSASACGALVRQARAAETQPALFVHPAARHWRRD